LKVACGPSFGAICLGSLVIAIVRALEKLMEKLQRDAREDGNAVLCVIACLLRCIISCIGDIMEWISSYVYVQVALRGLSFFQGAKATYALATITNLMFVVSAILVEYVALLGAVLCALGGAAVSGAVAYFTCGIPGSCAVLACIGGMFGCIGGMLSGGSAVGIINSGSVSILMCWAECPDVLAQTDPKIASKFEAAERKGREGLSV